MGKPLSGLIAAAHTPLRADGALDAGRIDALAAALGGTGLAGAFVCGTAGEGPSLTVAERREVLERWRAAAPPGLRVVAQVGCDCLPDAEALAAHAAEVGADAVATVAPTYFGPKTAGGLVDVCARIAAAAGETPFYYYHMPSRTHTPVKASAFLAAAIGRIPTLAGIKFTDNDLTDLGTCVELAGDRLTVLFGRTETLLSGLVLGVAGSIGGPYNAAAPLFLRIWRAYRASDLDEARRLQARGRRLGVLTKQYGGLPALKAMMPMVGLDCGPVRSPLTPLSEAQAAALERDLRAEGYFDGDLLLPEEIP